MNIAAPLRRLAVPVESLTPHPENPRRGNPEGLATSLERFGQLKPIVVQDSTSLIVAGNHTYRAVLLLGWAKIAAVRLPLSDEEAKAYMLADNRWSDEATNDDQALLDLLDVLTEQGALGGTGFTPDDADDIRALLDKIQETEPQPFAGGYAESQAEKANRSGANRPMHQFVLLLSHEEGDEFALGAEKLCLKWRVSLTQAVARAVAQAAAGL